MIPGDKSYYPGTDVLVNRFEIRDAATARALEYKFAFARELELREKPIAGNFDLAHLEAIHRHLFWDMYSWAGQLRDIDIAKRNPATGLVNQYTQVKDLDAKAQELSSFMSTHNHLKGLPKPEFVKAITDVFVRLNEIHPFREGNGRATRVFLTQLAESAGYKLDLTRIDADRWNLASHRALPQVDPKDPSKVRFGAVMDMRQIFHESLTPSMEHAFRFEARDAALRAYPGLQPAYDRLDAIAAAVPDKNKDVAMNLVAVEHERIAGRLATLTQDPARPAVEKLETLKGLKNLLSVSVAGRDYLSGHHVEEKETTPAQR